MDAVQAFYETVFGWSVKDLGPAFGNYRMVMTGEDSPGEKWPGINGAITTRNGNPPDGSEAVDAFVCTITVDNLDEYISKVKSAGGSIALDKMDVPTVGWLAYGKDVEGNIFGMLQPV